jgi:hypothetical protein
MTSLNNGNGKDLVSYNTGVPAVPPPPPPKNFTLEFKNLVDAFDVQRQGFEALHAEWEKRDRPVLELPRDFETDHPLYISIPAKRLLEKLQALWPDENIHHHASHDGIAMRLGLMRDRLPKGEETDAKSLIERVEAELPSIMALESTCHELEDGKEKFPLPRDILPVLQKQKRIWERRMESVDVERVERLSNEYTAGRQEQHAIVEKALRERLVLAGHKELLALLDVDKRVDECVHYVAAIANLHRENCTELADKLQQDFETYQRLSNVDEDDDNDAWSQAESKAQQTYKEALRVGQEKYYARKREEWEQERKEKERQQKQQKDEERERRWEEELWREALAEQELQEEMYAAMERAEVEHWEEVARSQKIEDQLFTKEVIAEIQKNGIPRLTEKERVRRKDRELMQELLRELKEQREEVFELRELSWDLMLRMLPEITERLEGQEKTMRELQDRLRDLE